MASSYALKIDKKEHMDNSIKIFDLDFTLFKTQQVIHIRKLYLMVSHAIRTNEPMPALGRDEEFSATLYERNLFSSN